MLLLGLGERVGSPLLLVIVYLPYLHHGILVVMMCFGIEKDGCEPRTR